MKKKILIIPFSVCLAIALLVNIPESNFARIVLAAGNPDSLGNQVTSICLQQYNGTDWNYDIVGFSYDGDLTEFPAGVTSAEEYYNSTGFSWRVLEDQPLRLRVVTYLNKTLADTEGDAATFTDLWVNITGSGYSLYDNFAGGVGSSVNATFWKVVSIYEWNDPGFPITGVSYHVEVEYYVYY